MTRRPRLDVAPGTSLADLPALVAALDGDGPGAILGDLPLPDLDVAVIDEVLRPAIGVLVDGVVADLDEVTASPLRGGAVERNVREVTEHALRQFAVAVETGDAGIDTSLYRELGRRHARAGSPLRELTELLSRGGRALWRGVLALERTDRTDTAGLLAACEAVFTFTAAVTSAAVEGFVEATAATDTARRTRRVELVRHLVRGTDLTDAELADEAAALGWPLPERVAVAVTSPGATLDPALPDRVLSAPDGARRLLLLAADPDGRPCTGPEVRDGTLAVGPVVDRADAARSQRVAEELLELVTEGLVPAGGTVRADDHAAALLLAAHPTLADVLPERWLGPLLALPVPRREPLLGTLRAWLVRPGQYTALAEELHVHVRTVRYRLDRLRELLGDVVDDPDRRLELALALRAVDRRPSDGRAEHDLVAREY